MGSIPEYREGGVARTSQLVDVQAPLREARQIQGIVNDVAKTVVTVDQISQKKLLAEDNNSLGLQRTDLRRTAKGSRDKFEQEYGENPNDPDALNKYINDRQKHFNEVSNEFKTKEGKEAFQKLTQDSLYNEEQSFLKWQTEKTKENLVLTNQKTVDNLTTEATETPKLESAHTAFDDLLLQKNGNISGLGEKNAFNLHQKASEDVATTYVQSALINGNIGEAKKMISDDRFKEALGAKGILRAKSQVKRFEEAQAKKLESINKHKNTNNWKYLEKVGETRGLAPLDFNNPISFLKREEFIAEMKDKHGVDISNQPISPQEIKGLQDFVISANDDELSGMLANLDANLTDESKSVFTTQLFPKSPALGAALQLASEDPETSKDILSGFKRINSKSLEIKSAGLEKEIDSQLLSIIDDDTQRNLMKEAIKAHAVETVFKEGGSLQDDVVDPDIVEQSINSVIGPVLKGETGYFRDDSFITGPSGVVSFRGDDGKFLNEGEFSELFDSLNVQNIDLYMDSKPTDGSGNTIDLAEFSSRFIVKTVGDGAYELSLPDGSVLGDQNGQPFILDLKSYYKNKNGGE